MKKAILSIAVLTLLFSCKKEDEKTPIVTIAKFAELPFPAKVACGSEVQKTSLDSSSFHSVPAATIYNSLKPALTLEYWEIVSVNKSTNPSDNNKITETSVASYGTKTSNDVIVIPTSGFKSSQSSFAQNLSFSYIKFQYNSHMYAIGEEQEIETFLGNIDSEADAYLLTEVKLKGVQGGFSLFGIKSSTTGYEILTHSSCLDVTEGHRLFIETCGNFDTWNSYEKTSPRCVE